MADHLTADTLTLARKVLDAAERNALYAQVERDSSPEEDERSRADLDNIKRLRGKFESVEPAIDRHRLVAHWANLAKIAACIFITAYIIVWMINR